MDACNRNDLKTMTYIDEIITRIAAFIQLNIAVLNDQADYERKRAALIGLLSMPVATKVALARSTLKQKTPSLISESAKNF